MSIRVWMSFVSRLWQDCKDKMQSKKVEETEEESDEEERDIGVCTRRAAAAPSTGNKKMHEKEYKALIVCALGEISAERLAEMKAAAEAEAKAQSEAKEKAVVAKEKAVVAKEAAKPKAVPAGASKSEEKKNEKPKDKK